MKLISLLTPNGFSKVHASVSDRSSNISACVVMASFWVVDDSTQDPKVGARRNSIYIYIYIYISGPAVKNNRVKNRSKIPMLTKQSASALITWIMGTHDNVLILVAGTNLNCRLISFSQCKWMVLLYRAPTPTSSIASGACAPKKKSSTPGNGPIYNRLETFRLPLQKIMRGKKHVPADYCPTTSKSAKFQTKH